MCTARSLMLSAAHRGPLLIDLLTSYQAHEQLHMLCIVQLERSVSWPRIMCSLGRSELSRDNQRSHRMCSTYPR